jgi:hypothetical protein
MKILNVYREDEFSVAVEAQDINGMVETFYVQLDEYTHEHGGDGDMWTEKYGADEGIPPDSSDYLDPDDEDYEDIPKIYRNFNYDEIIEAAEEHAREKYAEYLNQFTEKTIDFHCYVGWESVVMRIDDKDKTVELVIKDIEDLEYIETGVKFDSEEDALKYASTFETGAYEDFAGLIDFINAIRGNDYIPPRKYCP